MNLLVNYPEQIFEQQPLPNLEDTMLAEDLEALMHIFYVGRRANWAIMASRKTLDEIDKTPDPEHRERLRDFAIELISPEDEANAYASVVGRRMIDAPSVSYTHLDVYKRQGQLFGGHPQILWRVTARPRCALSSARPGR